MNKTNMQENERLKHDIYWKQEVDLCAPEG